MTTLELRFRKGDCLLRNAQVYLFANTSQSHTGMAPVPENSEYKRSWKEPSSKRNLKQQLQPVQGLFYNDN